MHQALVPASVPHEAGKEFKVTLVYRQRLRPAGDTGDPVKIMTKCVVSRGLVVGIEPAPSHEVAGWQVT